MKLKLLFLFLAFPLAAQNFEIGLNVSSQSYSGSTYRNFYPVPDINNDYSSKIVAAARLGYALVDMGPALFQVTVAYQPKLDTDLKPNGAFNYPNKLGSEYFGVGGMFNFNTTLAIGAGLDVRSERTTITSQGFPLNPTSNSYVRPWARLNVGYAAPSPVVKPFVNFEVAAPLVHKDDSANVQVGIYAGIRF